MSAKVLEFPKKNVATTKSTTVFNSQPVIEMPSLNEEMTHSLFLKSSWGNDQMRLVEVNHQTNDVKVVFTHSKKIRILEYIIKNYDLDKTYIPFIE